MSRQIIVSSTPQEARVAVMENARLIEIFIERARDKGLAGSIYKGRVNRVLPGMQAAFVDIGLTKAGYLHASDLSSMALPQNLDPRLGDADIEVEAQPATVENGDTAQAPAPPAAVPIEERLKKGQEILVQIAKEPIGSKGSRLTCNISLPGRHLVYLPLSQHLGISRRIVSEQERERLRQAVGPLAPGRGGIILRTACEGLSKREIQGDLRQLRKIWGRIQYKAKSAAAPALLHSDLDVILRTVRDLLSSDVTRVLIDNRRDYQRVVDFVETVMPNWRARVELYERSEPIFERYGIESQINKALERKVWLKSGGYITIDQTEALTAIDVNTGRFIGKTNLDDTILRTNLEAAPAVVDQLRLRNIGGLIVIDFIDMESAAHRKAVLEALTKALESDKALTTILGISDLGLVEMTRKRTRESLVRQLCEPCPACEGKGHVKAIATTSYELLRRIRREATLNGKPASITASVHPAVANFLRTDQPRALEDLAQELGVALELREDPALAPQKFELVANAKA